MIHKEKEMHTATTPQRWVSANDMDEGLQRKIQVRAYEIYQARGAEAGHELDDWVQAESEIVKQNRIPQAA